MEQYNSDKISKLAEWALVKNIEKQKLSNIFEMLHLGKRGEGTHKNPMQYPSYYIKDDRAEAWHDPTKYFWVGILEANFEAIRDESLKIFHNNLMHVHPENNDLAGYGTWNTFFFYQNGKKYIDNHSLCPVTSSILDTIPGVNIAGRTYFSAMTPGIHIKAHCGPHNFKLRTHLGIITPKDAVIRVGNITRPWEQGKCIVFDDSFEHEVWNRSKKTRIVLIVDVWNPYLDQIEIEALRYIMPEFYKKNELHNVYSI